MQILVKITSICKAIQAYVYLLNPSSFLGRILTLHPSSHQPFSFSHLKKIVPTQIHENLSHPWTNFHDFDSGCIKFLRDSDFLGFKWKFDRNFFKKLSKKSLLWFFEHPPSTAATHIQPTRQTHWVPSKKTLVTEQHKSLFLLPVQYCLNTSVLPYLWRYLTALTKWEHAQLLWHTFCS